MFPIGPVTLGTEFRIQQTITIRVRRQGEDIESQDRDLSFTPQKWGGRGLLG